MNSKPKNLENAIGKITKEAKSLEEFQNGLKELIRNVFICLLDGNATMPINDIKLAQIKGINLLKRINLLVVTYWSTRFSEGRIMSFVAKDRGQEQSFEDLAELNLQIFGRRTTLNERLLSFAVKHTDKDYVKMRMDIKDENDDSLDCQVSNNNSVTIKIGQKVWKELGKLPDGYENLRKDALDSKKISDGARTIRHIFGAELRKQRLNAIVNNWVKFFNNSQNEKSFFELLYELTPLEEIIRYRKKQDFISEEEENFLKSLKDDAEKLKKALVEGRKEDNISKLSLGLDFELVDEFASFLQALAHFYPNAKTFIGACKAEKGSVLPNYGRAFNLLSRTPLEIPDEVIKNIMDVVEKIEDKIHKFLPNYLKELGNKKVNRKNKKNDKEYIDKFQIALNKLKDEELKGKITKALINYDKITILLDAVGLISSKIHEGRRLSFTFLYGGGTSWRIIEEILSEEEKGDYQKEIKTLEDFAKIIEIHWSIFQQKCVAGFIDAMKKKALNPLGIPLTKIVKLKPYHTLPGSLFKKCVEFSPDSLIIYTSGNGIVRVFSYDEKERKGIELFMWDTVHNKIEQQSVDIENITKDILDLISKGGKP